MRDNYSQHDTDFVAVVMIVIVGDNNKNNTDCVSGDRLYGEKSADIIDGLKKNPVVAVPLVLRRWVFLPLWLFTCSYLYVLPDLPVCLR